MTDVSENISNFVVTNIKDDVVRRFLSHLIESVKSFEEQEGERCELVTRFKQELKDLADKLSVTESEIIEKLTAHATALKEHCNDSEKRLCSIETCVEMQIKKQLAEYNAEKKEMKDELEALKKELKTKSENENKERSQIKEEILRMREEMTLVTKDKDKTKEEEEGLHMKDFDDKPLGHKIKNLIGKLEDFAGQIVPADVTTRRKSIIETHSEEVQSKFVEPLLTNQATEEQPRPNGRGPLSHKDSGLSIISEGTSNESIRVQPISDQAVTDQSADQSINSSALSLDSGVVLREKTTSTPSVSVRMKKMRSISREDHTLLEVTWAMNDLLSALNKLYDCNS